jgi:hypothetical protein
MDDRVLIWGSGPFQGGGPHIAIAHGTLLTFGDNPVEFDIFKKGDLVRVRMEFPTDAGVTRAEYTTAAGTPGNTGDAPTIRMQFFNLVAGGSFTDGPVRVATVGGVALWVVYEVTTVPGSRHVKKIHYTLWDAPAKEGAYLIPGGGPRG